MAIPDFQSLMLPILNFHADGREHTSRDLIDGLVAELGLSEDDRDEPLPSGQSRLDNRVKWARTYLSKSGLLNMITRGTYQITDDGRRLLTENVDHIDMKLLQRYPEYVAWRSAAVKGRVKPQTEPKSEDQTPEEMIAEGYEKLKDSLGADILDHVKSCSPRFFERLVVKLLTRMGYGSALENAGRVVGRTGDGGIDGIIKEDKLGLDSIYIQAKRWEGSVGAGQVRDFAGSLDYHGAKKGVFITTSSFTKEARDFVGRLGEKKIVLIDGDQLADLMIEYDIGVSTVDTYQIKKVDSDYFEE